MSKLSDDIRDRATFSGQIAFDVGGVHCGYAASINARRWLPVGRFGALGQKAAVTYGSGDYMDTYFSVSPVDAAATGLPQHKANDGFRDARLMAMFIHPITKNCVAGGGVLYSRILGDAEDGPILEDRGKKKTNSSTASALATSGKSANLSAWAQSMRHRATSVLGSAPGRAVIPTAARAEWSLA